MVVDDEKWYTQRGGRLQGPYTRLTVHRYLLLGRIKNTDRVSRDGEIWEPITQVPELIPEELLDLKSDLGWQHFIRARDLVDQRQEIQPAQSNIKENRTGEQNFLQKIRLEWDDWIYEPESKFQNTNIIPISLFGLTFTIITILLIVNLSGS